MYKISLSFIALIGLAYQGISFCKSSKMPTPATTAQIRQLLVSYSQPVFDPEGNMFFDSSSYNVYYFKDLIMYEYIYFFDSVVNGKYLLEQDPRKSYFVYHKDSLFGYNYDLNSNKRMPDDKRLPVDSLRKKISLESTSMDMLLDVKADSVVGEPSNANVVKEVYLNPEKTPGGSNYTLYLHFDKSLNGIDESFSRKLDSARKMKLSKIQIFFKEMYIKGLKKTLAKREGLYEMKEIQAENDSKIMKLFTRYQQRIK